METDAAIGVLATLAQDTRVAIFRTVVEAGRAGMPAGSIAQKLDAVAPTLSFHLKELAYAGLIRGESRGRFVAHRGDYDAMNALLAHLTADCRRESDCTLADEMRLGPRE